MRWGMLPAVQMLVSQCGDGGQGWEVSSGIWITSSPWTLATFLWGGLSTFYRDQSSLPGSSGKMGKTIPRSCHIVRELGTRQETGPYPFLLFDFLPGLLDRLLRSSRTHVETH